MPESNLKIKAKQKMHQHAGSSPPPSPPTIQHRFDSKTSKFTANVKTIVPHVEDHEFELPGSSRSPVIPMIAGAIAGSMEHLCMYPVDTVKTRMQAIQPGQPVYANVIDGFASIAAKEGIPSLYRGVSAIVCAAIPSHAIYFATYEFVKKSFENDGHHVHAIGGAVATAAHDAVVTPVDVVKQRLQLHGSRFQNPRQVVRYIMQNEGIGAFYASYPTTLVMNVPFVSAHFVTYEFLKRNISETFDKSNLNRDSPLVHMLAGGGAGALGGLVSNPFDVIKTKIQTNSLGNSRSLYKAFKFILRKEGIAGFSQGLSARILYFIPSAAICWTTYEGMKKLLSLSL
mmetsp:Transcript_5435/g.9099  ORF Transcript_5435/g.9099 Transcript_5435/m.9099 type:complete len:342 (-) Transcript_5435:104-1129(-)|eukprot:jgi/Bigna1/55259/estExt_Genewise1Plus.C_550003